MKTSAVALFISGLMVWACYSQTADGLPKAKPNGPENAAPTLPTSDQAGYYATLNRRAIEFKAQADLLSQLAQEHRKRAQEISPDQVAKALWESDLAKEFAERAASANGLLNAVRKERTEFERSHPELVASAQATFTSRTQLNPDEAAFVSKVEERLAAVQQEIADALDAGRLYTAQLQTNTTSPDYSRIASQLQENSTLVRQLQKEASDLELKRLEFRALRNN